MWALIDEGRVTAMQPEPPALPMVVDSAGRALDPQPPRWYNWVQAPAHVCPGYLYDAQTGEFGAPQVPLAARQTQAWDRIQAERSRRLAGGVKVGSHWYHSDADSQRQQLALVIMGANLPSGLPWKTKSAGSLQSPVYVAMTPALAAQIFSASTAAASAIHAAAESHRVAMLASAAPESYDCSAGWPPAFWDAA
jgi:hypothetical protein